MIRWSIFFLVLFLYRSSFSIMGQLIITQFTTLGDAGQYQRALFTIGEVNHPGYAISYSITVVGTALTESVGAVLYVLVGGSRVLINVGFQAIAFIGIYKFLMSTPPATRKRLAFLVMLPSFTLWSSVASKESLIVFSVGIICSFLVDMYHNKEKIGVLLALAFVVLFLLKPQLLIAVGYVLGITIMGRYVREKASLAIGLSLVSMFPLYLFRDRIDAMAFEIPRHFAGTFGSTRETFWIEKYDVFLKAPYGMFQGFIGPTFAEAATGHLLHVTALAESLLLCAILAFFIVRRLPQIPIYSFILWLFTMFWILFPYYPLQIMNPGSAVRYRTGYLLLVLLAFTILLSRETFVSWSAPKRRNSAAVLLQRVAP